MEGLVIGEGDFPGGIVFRVLVDSVTCSVLVC